MNVTFEIPKDLQTYVAMPSDFGMPHATLGYPVLTIAISVVLNM